MIVSPSDAKSIFGRALDLQSPAERAKYLDEACQGNIALRAEIEDLIGAVARAGNFLGDASPGEQPIHDQVAEEVGTFVGPYKLLQQIGEGGMGLVYMAEQQHPVRRMVAMKIIKPGMDTRQVIARFEAERQALAMMDHANIAKVLDAGTTGADRPYFVMELVKGVPITTYCDQKRLTLQQRLELFLPVCQAVQHAHQKGIIHRDIKPTNVLIALYDGMPVPKVIDFGVAKATAQKLTEKTMFTGFGQLIGTLEYMSPEQANFNQLDIDTRSDIYSLGVLLYELLTGSTPFEQAHLRTVPFEETLRIIREVEPPKPSTRLSTVDSLPTIAVNRNLDAVRLRKAIRGELDWIVMKALEKDRNRRYETASGLAADIQAYLTDEPVKAGPPSTGYRLRRYARKYKKILTIVGAFAALLVAATAASIGLASWALKERNRAAEQQQAAEANFKKALEAVDKMLTRVGEVQLSHVPQMEPVRRDLLQDALRFYQDFLREKADDPLVRSEAARAYRRVGQIEVLLGQRDEAEEAYGQAAALLEKLVAESPGDPSFLNELAGVHNDLGKLYHSTQRWPQAEASMQLAVALLEQLEREHPTFLKNRHDLAGTHNNLLSLYRQMGRLGQAEAAFLKGMTLLDGLLAGDPENVDYLTLRARCYQNVALVYGAQGHTAKAEEACQNALALNEQLTRDHPEAVDHRRRLAHVYNNLGLVYARQGQHEKAEAASRKSLAIKEAILRDHPQVVAYIIDLASSYGNLATEIRRRSPEEALEWAARAIGLLEPVLEKDPQYVEARMGLFDTLMGRAYSFRRLGRHEDVAKEWRRVVEVSEGQPHINMRLYRPIALVSLGEHARGTAEIETLLAEGHAQRRNLYTFAYLHSLSSAAAANDARLSPAEREKLADNYGGRAVELLRQAHAAGYFQDPDRLAHMKKDKDLDPIRSRPDFQSLLGELEETSGTKLIQDSLRTLEKAADEDLTAK